jgi:two-component system, chemotaxis family, chemotaxis protein CheY
VNRLRVLVIEDSAVLRELYRDVLVDEGHTVAVAGNGEEGLALIAWQPDVIVLDLRMPVMDGFEFLRRIQLSRLPHPPVLIASATLPTRPLVGAGAIIQKPFDLSHFVRTVERVAGLVRSAEATRAEAAATLFALPPTKRPILTDQRLH